MNEEKSKEDIIESHMGLVKSIAHKWKNKIITYDYEDLVSIGYLEMTKALNEYSPAKGRFSTLVRTYIEHRYIKLIRAANRIKCNKYKSLSIDADWDRDIELDSLHDFIANENIGSVDKQAIDSALLSTVLREFEKSASLEEMMIIHKVYKEKKIYEQVAKEIGSSETTVRRRHNKAIEKMREIVGLKLA